MSGNGMISFQFDNPINNMNEFVSDVLSCP